MLENIQFPTQQLPFNRKTKKWRKQVMDWASNKTFFNYSPVRKSVLHKKINYDLLDGKLHMEDLELILNPDNLQDAFVPDSIPHYPIMNTKLEVLRGEEISRTFDWRVIVTNPNAISEIEKTKKEELFQKLQSLVEDTSVSEEDFNAQLEDLNDYYTYSWQDIREIRSNYLLKHYMGELNFQLIFNKGFMDAMAVGEEIYQCDIVGGEPYLERLNPLKLRIFKSGHSNRVEDADMIIYEDYWSPGKIIEVFYDVLTAKDMKAIEEMPSFTDKAAVDSMGNIDERYGFVNNYMIDDVMTSQEGFFWDPFGGTNGISNSLMPYDMIGNIRVLRVYWKSRRKVKKIKRFDPLTGEETFELEAETYVIDKDRGEEEKILWINEAWEGVKIGEDIYVNMQPRVVQYNRLSNPSRCHFGIIGSIYNLNESTPFSMVDRMKQYNYLYDLAHDKLVKLMARDLGKLVDLDFALMPKGWEPEKWIYFAKVNGIRIRDSFKEGNIGAATGKLAGAMNNASTGVVDASRGNEIQFYINLCEYLKAELSDIVGISKQREGQISNRETVGGVERATLQSSHITEWLFMIHDDIKRRVLECFIETAKIALRGKSKKFQYILPDGSKQMMEIDGDVFAENDYGLIVDNSNNTQKLSQALESLAQAALQNQTLSFSTIMKLYGSQSLAEKQRLVEIDEKKMQERAAQQQQQQMQIQQQQLEQQAQMAQMQMQQQDLLNQRDNETKIVVAEINSQAEADRLALMNHDDGIQEPIFSEEARANLQEKIREFDAKLKLDKEKLEFEKNKSKTDAELKRKQIAKSNKTK